LVDAEQMPYGDGSLANLLLVDVFHHLARPRRFSEEAARVSAEGTSSSSTRIAQWSRPSHTAGFTELSDSAHPLDDDLSARRLSTRISAQRSSSSGPRRVRAHMALPPHRAQTAGAARVSLVGRFRRPATRTELRPWAACSCRATASASRAAPRIPLSHCARTQTLRARGFRACLNSMSRQEQDQICVLPTGEPV
jgi:hypothetical protein